MSDIDPSAGTPMPETTPSPVTRSWLRRNIIAVIAVLVLAPLTLWVTFATEWASVNKSRATTAVVVETGDLAEYAGTGWKVMSVERIDSRSPEGIEAELPAGSDLVSVITQVTPDELDEDGFSPFCLVYLDELGANASSVSRSWFGDSFTTINRDTAEGARTYCVKEEVNPYLMESLFIVPSDTGDTLAMRLEVNDEMPVFLRFRL